MVEKDTIELIEPKLTTDKDVRVVKFIERWRVYPNGDMFFMDKFPIGEEKKRVAAKGRFRKKKVTEYKSKEKEIEEETV